MDIIAQISQFRDILVKIEEENKLSPISGQEEQRRAEVLRQPGESEALFQVRKILLAYAIDFLKRAEEMSLTLDFTPQSLPAVYDALPCAFEHNRYQLHLGRVDNRALLAKSLGAYLALTLCHSCGGQLQVQEFPDAKFDPTRGVLNTRLVATVRLPSGQVVNPIDIAGQLTATLTVDGDRFAFDETPVEALFAGCGK